MMGKWEDGVLGEWVEGEWQWVGAYKNGHW